MSKTKSIKVFSNAEVLALNCIGSILDKYTDLKLEPSTHHLMQEGIFEAVRQLAKNGLLKCELKEIFD